MKLEDLGEIDTQIVVFGGPYSNLQATQSVLSVVEVLNARAICTGDVVAYCADPMATVTAVRQAGVHVVAGNCERQLGAGAKTCGCGFDAGSTCDLLSARWYAHADAHVASQAREWMRDLPDIAVFTQAGRRFAVIHGGATDVSRFLWPNSADTEFAEEMEVIQRVVGHVDGVLCGHSGVAFQRQVAHVRWVNAGAIGMPAHDGRQTTRYAVLKDGRAELHDLTYDAVSAHDAMVAAGLSQGYHAALLTGYWPSEDVLPSELRRADVASG